MSCHEIETQLDGLLEGRLPAGERRRIEAHLDRCPRCRDLWAAVRGSLAALPRATEVDLADEVLRRTSGPACGRAGELLSDLVDGTLVGADRDLMRGHLEHCTGCAALAEALGEAIAVLPGMAEVDPGAEFTRSVLRRTTPVWRPSVLRAWWEALLRRPRLAWEGAYVGAFVLFLAFGTPLSPMRDVPARALALARTNPVQVVEANIGTIPAVSARILDYGDRAWQATGGRVLEGTRPTRQALAARMAAAWSVTGSFQRHGAAGWQAFLEGDFEAFGARLKEMGRDLKTIWIRLTTTVPEAAGEKPEAQEV